MADGLRIRYATSSDVEELAAFNQLNLGGEIFATSTRELMVNKYDSPISDRCLIVEDYEAKKIVSAIGLIIERLYFGGIPVPCARIKLIATDPACRGQGLVRALFQAAQAEFQEMIYDLILK